jgi:hypothetical protein
MVFSSVTKYSAARSCTLLRATAKYALLVVVLLGFASLFEPAAAQDTISSPAPRRAAAIDEVAPIKTNTFASAVYSADTTSIHQQHADSKSNVEEDQLVVSMQGM